MVKFTLIIIVICSFFQEQCLGEYSKTNKTTNIFIKKKIKEIPQTDRIFLENFFSELIRKEGLGYVLFGSKPLCLSGYFVHVPIGNILMGCDSFLIRKGWEVWQTYEHLFPHPNYLIFEEKHVRNDKNIHPIYFVNIDNTLSVLNKNKHIFEKEISNDFNPDKFLYNLKENHSLSKAINFHEGLLGILLGYGVESSMKYYFKDLSRSSFQFTQSEELESIWGDSFSFMDFIYPIYFAGDPTSAEVKNILEENAKEQADLQEIYSNGQFLEITLQKLMEK